FEQRVGTGDELELILGPAAPRDFDESPDFPKVAAEGVLHHARGLGNGESETSGEWIGTEDHAGVAGVGANRRVAAVHVEGEHVAVRRVADEVVGEWVEDGVTHGPSPDWLPEEGRRGAPKARPTEKRGRRGRAELAAGPAGFF